MAGFPVWGLYNRSHDRADAFDNLDATLAGSPKDVIFDLALTRDSDALKIPALVITAVAERTK